MGAADATRRQALARGLAAGGALAAGSAGLALAGAASAKGGDPALVERAIRLEQAAEVLYAELAEGDFLDDELVAAAELFAEQQREHVAALTAALEDAGEKAPSPPEPGEIDGLDEAESQPEALALAVDVENALIRAYGEVVETSSDPAVLKTITEIACNAAQHLVVLRQQLGKPPLPEDVETGEPEEG
jgi:rubrerythrin